MDHKPKLRKKKRKENKHMNLKNTYAGSCLFCANHKKEKKIVNENK